MKLAVKNVFFSTLYLGSFFPHLSAQGAIYGSSMVYSAGNNVVAVSSTDLNPTAAQYYLPSMLEGTSTLSWNSGNSVKTFIGTHQQVRDPFTTYRVDSTHAILFKSQYTWNGFSYYSDPCDIKYYCDNNVRGDTNGVFLNSHLWKGADSVNENLHFSTIAAITNWRSVFGKTYFSIGPVEVHISPLSAILYPSQTKQFTSSVINLDNSNLTWSVSPDVGTISSSGLYTAPNNINSKQTIAITATSVTYPNCSDTSSIELRPLVNISVGPNTSYISGGSATLTAVVTGTIDTRVNWISNGLLSYSAKSVQFIEGDPGVYTATATSVADPTKSATMTISVLPVPYPGGDPSEN